MSQGGVLIVAERPKTKDNVDQPMLGTKSYKTLLGWLESSELTERVLEPSYSGEGLTVLGPVAITNATSSLKGKPTKDDELRLDAFIEHAAVVVTLGKVAEETVLSILTSRRRLSVPTVVSLPHPSGLNRKLNSKKERRLVERKLAYVKRLMEIQGL